VSKRILTRKMWNHVIETKKEQLRKGYIRLSKSPQIALVFFIEKKNNKKYIIQNYRYLNKWTIKNNYTLLLILDIVKSINIKKIFTKLNL